MTATYLHADSLGEDEASSMAASLRPVPSHLSTLSWHAPASEGRTPGASVVLGSVSNVQGPGLDALDRASCLITCTGASSVLAFVS